MDRTDPLRPCYRTGTGTDRLTAEDQDMATTFSKRHFQDTSRINLHEDWEVRFWSDKWNVSRPELIDAVKRVGIQVRDVARALGKG